MSEATEPTAADMRKIRDAIEAVIEDDHENEYDMAVVIADRVVAPLMTELAEAKQVLAEEVTAIGEERIATRRVDVLDMLRERDSLKAAVERVARLRDKWLAWPEDDMHYAAGLMLDRHLSGEAFTVDARPVSVESPGNDGFRYERAVALPPGVTADVAIARRGVHAETAELERLRGERDDYLDRLRKAEGAYSRLDAQKRDLEGVRDRLKARTEQAEAAVERARQMAQVWVDIRPTHPTASDAGHGIAYAGQQILDTLAIPETPGGES